MSKKISYSNIQQIAIADIDTGGNYRTDIQDEPLQELAESIKSVGLIQAIVVTFIAEGKYKLVVGERRLRASLLAGKKVIDARVVKAKPEQIPYIQLVENIHREATHELDESAQFIRSMKTLTVEDIARTIGKSEQYVYDRIHLKKLLSTVKELFRNGHLTMSHCQHFTKLTTRDQLTLLERIRYNKNYTDKETDHKYKYLPASDVKKIVEKEFCIQLSRANFDKADTKLIKEAKSCNNCPKMSSHNQFLFDRVGEKDLCYDRSCFDLKVKAHAEKIEAELKANNKPVVRITRDMFVDKSLDNVKSVYDYQVDKDNPELWGVIFTGGNISEIGTVLPLRNIQSEEEPDTDEPVPVSQKVGELQAIKLKEIRIANAQKAYQNKLGNLLSQKIGGTQFSKIPASVCKSLALSKLQSLTEEVLISLLTGLEWTAGNIQITEKFADINNESLKSIFDENTSVMTYDELIEFTCTLVVFDAMHRNQLIDLEFKYIFELGKEMGMEATIKSTLLDIAQDFEVEAETIHN
ncbi:MAG: ParB/RepB/Spo0J family partition protein [Acinetobacter sp.]|uniref:ParB/RepB/Spo0J family partition protein n=1 Tax=Acinetobacter sp. TaxID=472 RepID=UPI000FBAFE4C|nr:ParB/RepB/Spo0J family partition protein [Acinetobacter sp.]RUP42318.1 MAG: ParB/RepB/Spo0J family partition protein [Acinetobacter sp.]